MLVYFLINFQIKINLAHSYMNIRMLRNPYTGRLIQEGGETHRRLLANQYGGLFGITNKKAGKDFLNESERKTLYQRLEKVRIELMNTISSAPDMSKADRERLHKAETNISLTQDSLIKTSPK
jgi:hypothetical protein